MSGTFTDGSRTEDLDPQIADMRDQLRDSLLVAVYETNNGAHMARDALAAAGTPGNAVHVIDRHEPDPAGNMSTRESRRTALLGAFSSLFSRSENAGEFNLVADPNHAVVVLSQGAGVDQARARQILQSCNPVEIYHR